MDITLKHPVKLATGQTIAKLTLRRPKVRDLKEAQRISDKPGEQELALIARLAGLTPEDVEELDLSDYRQLAESFRGMLDQG